MVPVVDMYECFSYFGRAMGLPRRENCSDKNYFHVLFPIKTQSISAAHGCSRENQLKSTKTGGREGC